MNKPILEARAWEIAAGHFREGTQAWKALREDFLAFSREARRKALEDAAEICAKHRDSFKRGVKRECIPQLEAYDDGAIATADFLEDLMFDRIAEEAEAFP